MYRLIAILYLYSIFPAIAQGPLLNYEKSEFERDIIYEQIEGILIDSDGFNWIGTSTGLHKYDGYSITTYIHDSQDKRSISEDFVTTLFEDSRGMIWVGTYNGGLNVFDKRYGSFYRFKFDSTDNSTISSNRIPRESRIITEDKEGFIWINTENGLNRIDLESKEVEKHSGELFGQIIVDDQSNILWIGGENLKKYDPERREIATFEIPGIYNSITSIVSGPRDLIWIGTNFGTYAFNTSENKFYSLNALFESQEAILQDWNTLPVSCLYVDVKDNLWIGVEQSIYILNTSSGTFKKLTYDPKEEYGLLNENIRGIYGGHTGNVLVTYETQGLTKINTYANKFRRIKNITEKPQPAGKIIVRSILKDKHDNLWVGTNNNGLSKISGSKPDDIRTYLAYPNNPFSLNSNYITALYIDKDERLWVGTFENGFNYTDDIYKSGKLKFTSSTFTENIEIHEFTEDIAGRIWISTNHGIYIYDKAKEKLIHYGDLENQEPLLKSMNVQSVIQESSNVFWFATWNSGVVRLTVNSDPLLSNNNSKDELLVIDEIKDEDGNKLDNRLINILKDNNGNFWLATNLDGLIKMSLRENGFTFRKFDERAGAPSNQVYAIVQDHQGFIWISTSNGIGKLNPNTNYFTNFYESDGILSNIFTWDSYYQDKAGEIYFGGFDGITAFHPDSLFSSKSYPRAYIRELVINHLPVNVGDTVSRHFIMNKHVRFMESITLTHNESVISMEFGALNVAKPGNINFAYKLEGFDKDWIYKRTKNRVATYTNLEKGTYVFRIMANKDVGGSNNEASLTIQVIPPWWKTNWANMIYILVFGGLLYLFQRELNIRAKMRSRLEMEQYKHERDNELNREKFRFFTTLSHELRTPLTLILGPLDRILNGHETNYKVTKNLLLMQKQAQRLYKLTNQLMNFRKYEIENLKLRTAEGNIIQFVKEICLAFKQLAEMNKISFDLSYDNEVINAHFDRDKLEIIIVNLLSNAFKFTPENGEVNLEVNEVGVSQAKSLIQTNPQVPKAFLGEFPENIGKVIQIKIKDTGMGIKDDQVSKIFERYYQASNTQNLSAHGTGIGLEIVKNYVELHHGCIMVESEINVGTTFYLWIPMGQSHLTDEEILQDFKPSEHQDHYRLEKDVPAAGVSEVYSSDLFEPANEKLPTLLIVDDNPEIVYYLKEIFHKEFNLITAPNGKKGLQKAFSDIPDLIISDIMMPEMDGFEFCKQIKTDIRTSHIPVILLTARTSELFHSRGIEIGADDYINKPFDEKILKLRVKNLIATRKKLRERFSKELNLLPVDLSITNPDKVFLDKVIKIIEKNIDNSDLKIESMTREMGMSHSVLYKKVMALTDLTIVEFIRTIRLKKAAMLLAKTNIPINQISQKVGFTDPKYFSKCFQQLYGETPSSYKKQYV